MVVYFGQLYMNNKNKQSIKHCVKGSCTAIQKETEHVYVLITPYS